MKPHRTPLPFDMQLKGLRIPFVAGWQLEDPDITVDPLVMHAAVYTGKVDHRQAALAGKLGKPTLGQMAPQRQRYCMAHSICQVCGLPLIVKVQLGSPVTCKDGTGGSFMAFDEPPCCPACALVAITQCPFASQAWATRGGLLVDQVELFMEMAELRKGDDYSQVFKGTEVGLPRATFRRWMGKPLVVHLRMVPITGAQIDGTTGVSLLTELAREQAQAQAASA